jgi:hypothetical protein
MPPLEFRLSPAQRAANAAWSIGLFAILGVLRMLTSGVVYGIAFFALGLVVSVLNFGLGALWSLTLTAQGVTIRRYGTTVIAWPEIQSVTERNWLGTTQVKFIRLRGGAKISLAPMTHWLVKDPEFEQKLATIRQWHMQYAGGYGQPGFPQPTGQQAYPVQQQAYPAQQSFGQQPYVPQQPYPASNPYPAPNPYPAQQPYGQPHPQQAYPYGGQQGPGRPPYPNLS